MKKFFATIVTLLYLVSTTGATVHLHYCMDKLVAQNLWHSEEKSCSKCGMEKKLQTNKGCCKDEHKQVKVENDHVKSDVAFQVLQLAAVTLPVSYIEIPQVSVSSVTEENPTSHAPPRSGSIALYKRNGVFRI